MAIQSKEVTVGDTGYIITSYNAKDGLKYFMQLAKTAAPLLGLVSNPDELSSAQGLTTLVEVMNIDGMDKLIIEMFSGHVTDANGKEIQFSLEFAANYGAMLKVFIEILKLNYSSFLSEGGLNLDLSL